MNKQKKPIQKDKTMKKTDRSWIRPPNSISKQSSRAEKKKDKNYPSVISYWFDEKGEAQLYTAEQLAICNVLTNLKVVLNKSLTLAEQLKTMDKDITVGILSQQDYAQFKELNTTVFGYFIELMSAAPDITFGEFLNFITEGDDVKLFKKVGKKKLKQIIENKSPDVTTFYRAIRIDLTVNSMG